MRNLVLFLLLIAAVAIGIQNREAIKERFSHPAEKPPEPIELPPMNTPAATPHPATEARAAAIRACPALGQKESIFNKTFLVLYGQAQQSEPELLAKPDWPMTLAKRTSASLTLVTPAPTPRPPPPTPFKALHGSALDIHPSGKPAR